MTVVKKSGKHEEYSSEKLTRSLQRANNGTGEEIDLKSLSLEFYRVVEGKSFITVQQIDVIVCGLLYTQGYKKTLDAYLSYDEKNRSL